MLFTVCVEASKQFNFVAGLTESEPKYGWLSHVQLVFKIATGFDKVKFNSSVQSSDLVRCYAFPGKYATSVIFFCLQNEYEEIKVFGLEWDGNRSHCFRFLYVDTR